MNSQKNSYFSPIYAHRKINQKKLKIIKKSPKGLESAAVKEHEAI